MAPTTYKLRASDEQIEAWKKRAENAGLKLAEWMRRRCDADGNAEDGVGVGDLDMGRGRTGAARGVAGRDRADVVDRGVLRVSEAVAVAVSGSFAEDSIEAAVAIRAGHRVGCPCFHCAQTYRFIVSQRKSAEKATPPAKSRGVSKGRTQSR